MLCIRDSITTTGATGVTIANGAETIGNLYLINISDPTSLYYASGIVS